MKRIKQFILAIGIISGIALVATPVSVGAVDAFQPCATAHTSTVCGASKDNINTYITTIVNVLLYILGAVSVVVIIVAGILYTTSAGDSSKVTTAKNTLLYAVVGLVVAVLAYAIVNFVVKIFA